MRKMLKSAAALATALFLPMAAHTPLAQGTSPTAVVAAGQARVIVKYRADSPLLKKQAMTAAGKRILQAQALGDRIGIALAPGIGITERSHVVFASGMDSKTLAARIAAESDIEYAVPDQRKHIVAAPNDSFYATRPYAPGTPTVSGGPLVGQWYLKPPGAAGTAANTAPASINAEQAWDLTTGSSSVVVADLDTGLRFDHPDLQGGNVLPGYDMVGADSDGSFSTANDGNGRDPDASDPGDWVSSSDVANNPIFANSNCTIENSSWHGTQTAGLIGAATNNSLGIASVGYGNVKVMPVRVLGKCGGYDSDIIAGMLWAAGVSTPSDVQFSVPTPARVLNMSLGGAGTCDSAYQDAVNQVVAAGAVIVVAAGNSEGLAVGTPANCAGVIAVAGLRHVGDKVGFSDLGPEIAISAPGGNCINTDPTLPCLYPIMTTSNSGTTTPVVGAVGGIYTDAFNASLGTSFSTPLVTGTVALMLSAQPSLTPAEVKAALQASARPFPTTGGTTGTPGCVAPTSTVQDECYCPNTSATVASLCGAGMLDAHAAVLAAIGVQARIADSTASPTAGAPVVLTSTSVVGSGDTIASYVWAITSAGTTGATITSGQGTPTLTVTPTAAGVLSASLTATDTFGNASTTSATVTVAAASGGGGGGGGSSSSGGGALGIGWFSLLLAAVLALAAANHAERRRAAALSVPRRPFLRRR